MACDQQNTKIIYARKEGFLKKLNQKKKTKKETKQKQWQETNKQTKKDKAKTTTTGNKQAKQNKTNLSAEIQLQDSYPNNKQAQQSTTIGPTKHTNFFGSWIISSDASK